MRTDRDDVILVDEEDRDIGRAGKMDAHRRGLLHRAISVCILDDNGRMLLQRRASAKYHSGGLWTNACCTHPRPGEAVDEAASRRLREEMGVDCALSPLLTTIYRAPVDHGLTEHELVHVFVGRYTGAVDADPDEVEGHAWLSQAELFDDMTARPQAYTYWFRHYLRSYADAIFAGGPAKAPQAITSG